MMLKWEFGIWTWNLNFCIYRTLLKIFFLNINSRIYIKMSVHCIQIFPVNLWQIIYLRLSTSHYSFILLYVVASSWHISGHERQMKRYKKWKLKTTSLLMMTTRLTTSHLTLQRFATLNMFPPVTSRLTHCEHCRRCLIIVY